MKALFVSVMLVAPAASCYAQSDTLLAQVLAASRNAAPVAFERTLRAELRVNPAKEPSLAVDRFTPTTGGAGNWTLLNYNGHAPTAAELETYRRTPSKAPGFHNLHRLLAAAPSRRLERGNQIIYQWTTLPKGSVNTPGGDISKNMAADLTLHVAEGKPVLEQVRVYAPSSFRVKIVASVNKFTVTSHYRPGANGVPFLYSQTIDSDVSAPMGFGGKRRNTATFRPL